MSTIESRVFKAPADTAAQLEEYVRANAGRIEIERRASALPDSLFDDHPDVIRLRESIAVAERRYAVRVNPSKANGLIGARLAALQSEIHDREDALADAALDDAAHEDQNLSRTVAALAKLQELRQQAQAAEIALESMKRPLYGQDRAKDALDSLRRELSAKLRQMKIQNIEAEGRQ